MRSFLKWAGSKRLILPKLLEKVPDSFDRYVEPFAGSACLFFALEPSKALLADINPELVGAYQQLKKSVDVVLEALSKFHLGKRQYYKLRRQKPTELPAPERAARFIYLNRFCFNGLYRTNQKGEFNVPFAGIGNKRANGWDYIKDSSKLLKKNVRIEHRSFERTLELVKTGDFVYLDPPYSIESRRVFNEYSNACFGEDQLLVLRSHLDRLNTMGIPFLVSYGQSREASRLGKGFRVTSTRVRRNIAGFSNSRRKAWEMLITNF